MRWRILYRDMACRDMKPPIPQPDLVNMGLRVDNKPRG